MIKILFLSIFAFSVLSSNELAQTDGFLGKQLQEISNNKFNHSMKQAKASYSPQKYNALVNAHKCGEKISDDDIRQYNPSLELRLPSKELQRATREVFMIKCKSQFDTFQSFKK